MSELTLVALRRLQAGARLLGTLAVIGASTSIALVLYRHEWQSDSQFVPSAGGAGSGSLSSLAAQFGVSIGGEGEDGPRYYARLLRSRELLMDVLETVYRGPSDSAAVGQSLFTLLQLPVGEHADSLGALQELDDRLTVLPDLETNIVEIRVTMPEPWLAEAVNQQLLNELSTFNLERRQSQARSEREFLAARVLAARAALDSAEYDLRRFHELNRTFRESARLQVEEGRLQRRVDLRQQIYTSLSQAEEQARIEEVRDTPVLTVIDAPQGSARKAHRLSFAAVSGGAFGLMLGVLLIVIAGYWQALWSTASSGGDT